MKDFEADNLLVELGQPRGSGETRTACPAGRVMLWGGWVDDADDWYAAMLVILAERAPA